MSFSDWAAQWAQSLYDNADAQLAQKSTPNPFDPANTGQAIPTFTPSSWIQNFVNQQPTTPAPVPTLDTSIPAPFAPTGNAPYTGQTRLDESPTNPTAPPTVDLNATLQAFDKAAHPTGNSALDIALQNNPLAGPALQVANLYPVVREAPIVGDVLKAGEGMMNWLGENANASSGLIKMGARDALAQIPGGEAPNNFAEAGTSAEEIAQLRDKFLRGEDVGAQLARLKEIGLTSQTAFEKQNMWGALASSMLFDPLNFIPGAGIGEAQKFRKVAEATADVTKIGETLKDAPLLARLWDKFSPLARAGEGELLDAAKLGIEQATGTGEKIIKGANPFTAFQKTPLAKAIDFTQRVHDWLLPQAASEGLSRAQMADLLDVAAESAKGNTLTDALKTFITDRKLVNSADFQRTIRGALGYVRDVHLDETYNRGQELLLGLNEWTQTERPTVEALKTTLTESKPFREMLDSTALSANQKGAFQRFAKTLDAYEQGIGGVGKADLHTAVQQLNQDLEAIGKMELAAAWVDNSARVIKSAAKLPDEAQLAERVMNKIRAYESALLLAANPHYVAQNVVNDWVRLAMHGVNPMESAQDINNLFGRAFGTSDMRSIMGEIGDALKTIDRKYIPNAPVGMTMPQRFGNLPIIKQLGDFNQLMNERSRVRAFYTGFTRAYKANWKYGTTLPRMPAQLEQAILNMGGESVLKSVVKKLENSFNAQEMRDALKTPFPMWQAYADTIAPELEKAFTAHGINLKVTPDALEWLISHGTGDTINNVLQRTYERAQTEGMQNFGKIWEEERAAIKGARDNWQAEADAFERDVFGQGPTIYGQAPKPNAPTTRAPLTDEALINALKQFPQDRVTSYGATSNYLNFGNVHPDDWSTALREMEQRGWVETLPSGNYRVTDTGRKVAAGQEVFSMTDNAAPVSNTLNNAEQIAQNTPLPQLRTAPYSSARPGEAFNARSGGLRGKPFPSPNFDELPPQDIRRYVYENPALNATDPAAFDHLVNFKKADGTSEFTAQQLATWKPQTIEQAAIERGFVSGTYGDAVRLFEGKTGKKAANTGPYLTNLLNAEIKRKGYFDPDLAAIAPFKNIQDVQQRPFDAYKLIRGYNEYPTMQQGEFMSRLRTKMLDDITANPKAWGKNEEAAYQMMDAVETVYDSLAASAAKARGMDVDTFWQKAVGGVENGTGSSQDWRALKQESANWYFSQLTRELEGLKQDKFTAEQLRGMLKGKVKDAEMKWTGFDEWLTAHPKATKQEALDYLAQNNVQVREVMRGNAILTKDEALAKLQSNPRTNIWREDIPTGDPLTANQIENLRDDMRYIIGGSGTKYDKYTLPGGENYREMLLTMPHINLPPKPKPITTLPEDYVVIRNMNGNANSYPWGEWGIIPKNQSHGQGFTGRYYATIEEAKQAAIEKLNASQEWKYQKAVKNSAYKSGHFEDPNILAHVRFNDRTTADGKRMLFVEEIQSDWAQAGRDKGFKQSFDESKANADRTRFYNGKGNMSDADWTDLTKRIEFYDKAERGVPSMPFPDTYEELALKRMLRYASDNGYDAIGWTTGAQQAARYDLAKQVDSIRWSKFDDGQGVLYRIIPQKDGKMIFDRGGIAEKDLPELLGKEMARNIVESNQARGVIEGADLTIGGEGMKAAYDKRIPNKMNALAKKFGGKVGETTLDVGAVHSIDVTPEMRAQAQNGFPLFQGAKGETSFLTDSRALLRFFQGEADPTTYVHEAAHMFMPTLADNDMHVLAQWVGLDDGATLRDLHTRFVSRDAALGQLPKGKKAPYQFRDMAQATSDIEKYTIAQEKFARGFEKYLAEGNAPSEGLARVFEQFKNFLLDVYHGVLGSEIDVTLTDEMRSLYGKMLDADQVIDPKELARINAQANREVLGEMAQQGWGVGAHLQSGFFDGFFQHNLREGKKVWMYRGRVTPDMPHWWYPVSNGRNIGTTAAGSNLPPFVSAIGPKKAQLFGTSKKDWKLVDPVAENLTEWADVVLEHYNQVLFPDGSRQLETIDDLLKFVDENIAHNTAFTLEQRASKLKKAGQLDMFADAGRVDDLPLFSGTPQQVAESAFTPPVNTGQQGKLFDTRPEFGGMENAAKPMAEAVTPELMTDKGRADLKALGYSDKEINTIAKQNAMPSEGKPAWQMTRKEYADDAASRVSMQSASRNRKFANTFHKGYVEDALKQGKPVPAEVLADYPDLAAKYAQNAEKPIAEMPSPVTGVKNAPKEAWQMTRDEYVASMIRGKMSLADETAIAKAAHPQHIKKAIAEGKDVPLEVLQDYAPNQWAKNAIAKKNAPTLPPQTDTGQFTLFQQAAERLKTPEAIGDPTLKADLETALAEELLRILRPVLEKDMGNYGRALDLNTLNAIEAYIADAEPIMNETKNAAQQMGRWYHQHTTMDYSQRWNVDDAMNFVAPFTFYPLHMAANLTQDFLDRPALFAMYAHLQNQIDKQSEGLPKRFAHRIKIPMPFLPQWMGDGVFVDPFATMFPVRQVFNLDDLERATFNSQNGEPMDNTSLLADMYGTHLPYKLGYQLLTGDAASLQDTVANLPPMRMAKAAGAPYDLSVAGFKPLQGKWDEFYLQRAARDLVANGTLDEKQMKIALLTRKGNAWQQIVEHSRLQNYTAPVLSGWTGFTGKIYPAGEIKYNDARMEKDRLEQQLLDQYGASPSLTPQQQYEFLKAKGEYNAGGQMRAFLDANPELEGAQAMGDTEQMYRSYLQDGIWETWQNASALQKKLWKAELGDTFAQSFLNKDTRAYDQIPTQALLGWANALKVNLPDVTDDLQTTPDPAQVTFPNAAQNQAYEQFRADVETSIGWDNYYKLNDQYQQLRATDKTKASAWLKTPEGQKLIAVWDAQDAFYKEHPDIQTLLEKAGAMAIKRAAETPNAGTTDAQKQAWMSALNAIGYASYDEYKAESEAYYTLSKGSQARRDYLATHPRLARQWAASRAIYGDSANTGQATNTKAPYQWKYYPKQTYTRGSNRASYIPKKHVVSYGDLWRGYGSAGARRPTNFVRIKTKWDDGRLPRRIMPNM